MDYKKDWKIQVLSLYFFWHEYCFINTYEILRINNLFDINVESEGVKNGLQEF